MRSAWMWILLCGCTAGPMLETVLAVPDGPAGPGFVGPFGVARTSWRAPVRVTESSRVEVHVPVDEGGDRIAGPLPPVVFVNGGLVEPARYRWWAEHVASRGYVVITTTHPADLAIFAQGTSTEALYRVREAAADPDHALAGVVDPDTRAAVTGHSLGGVVASRSFVEAPDQFATLGIIASFPADWDDITERAGDPVLSIVGENDGSADLTRVADAILAQPEPSLYAVVEGFNHYDWADGVTEGELARDGERARDVAEARTDAMRVMDTWLDAWMRDDDLARINWQQGEFPGVEVTR